MKYGLLFSGALLTVGFGTNFLIRLIRTGDFYIGEYTISIIGILLVLTGLFVRGKINQTKKLVD